MLIAIAAIALPCSIAAADIDGPFGGGGAGDLDGAHTVQEGAEDPNWNNSSHTVQEGIEPTIDIWDWDLGFDVPMGFDTTSLTLEQNVALHLGFVEITPAGELQFIENWTEAAFYNYGLDQELMEVLGKLSKWQLAGGNLTNLSGIMLDPRSFYQDLIDSGVTYAPPTDPNLPSSTGDVPAPGSLVLLALGGLAASCGQRRRRRRA